MNKEELLESLFDMYGYRYTEDADVKCSDSALISLGAIYKRSCDLYYDDEWEDYPIISYIILTPSGIYPWYDPDYAFDSETRKAMELNFNLLSDVKKLIMILDKEKRGAFYDKHK